MKWDLYKKLTEQEKEEYDFKFSKQKIYVNPIPVIFLFFLTIISFFSVYVLDSSGHRNEVQIISALNVTETFSIVAVIYFIIDIILLFIKIVSVAQEKNWMRDKIGNK